MQKYSLTVLVKEKVSESQRKEIFDGLKKNFSNLIKEDLWGVRSLAYEIKHDNKAYYANFEFEAEPKAIITLDKNIRLTEDIIRHLIVRIEQKRQKIKVVKEKIQEKAEPIEKEEPELNLKEIVRKGKSNRVVPDNLAETVN